MHTNVSKILIILISSALLGLEKEEKINFNTLNNNNEQINDADLKQNYKDSIRMDSSGCNPGLWKNVYNPSRLKVINECITVSGLIEESNADEDGDQHMLLKLDKGQKKLLTKKNYSKKSGDLVIEAICINTVTLPKVKGACKGYMNHVQIPKVSDHVSVTGSYVIDSHNGWAEIHPISKIEVR